MPRESDLPESLRPLTRLNALKLRDDDWESDVEKLVRAVGLQATPRLARSRPAIAVIATLVFIAVGAAYLWWGRPSDDTATVAGVESKSGSYHDDIVEKLGKDQYKALGLLNTDRPQAIRLTDDNLSAIDEALRSFPEDVDLHVLAGYAAKNVFASSKGILSAERRPLYLKRAASVIRARALAQAERSRRGQRHGQCALLRAPVRRGHRASQARPRARRRQLSRREERSRSSDQS